MHYPHDRKFAAWNLGIIVQVLFFTAWASGQDKLASPWKTGRFKWSVSRPVLEVRPENLPASPDHPWIAVKDPSIVKFEDQWHLFATLRKKKKGEGRIRIGCCRFTDWKDAKDAKWDVLELTPGYHGAPQIFFFEPQQKWYLIYQAADPKRGLAYGPCFSVNVDIKNPKGWSLPQPLYSVEKGEKAGLDFWVLCDDEKAHLLFTSLDGCMRYTSTKLKDFPNRGWAKREVVLRADIFEASHTYKLSGLDQYLTLVEAQRGRRRYFKFFVAKGPRGPWRKLAASAERPAVSPANVINQSDSWANSYSHGEVLRLGYNQKLEIDPKNLRILFQGASDQEYQKGGYGDITWRLGLLDQVAR